MAEESKNAKKTNILLVDDEPYILNGILRLCRKRNDWNVMTASSPKEALQILSEQNVIVLITDHQMPGMKGADFLAAIKTKRPNMIKIMLTGQADNEAIKKAVNEGDLYKYITKPWNDDELLASIDEAIDFYHRKMKDKQELKQSIDTNLKLTVCNEQLGDKVKERTRQLEDSLYTLKDINSKLLHSLYQSSRVLCNIIELAKPLIGSHSKKVMEISLDIARCVNHTSTSLQELEIAAMLHDIGKIGFPSFMLEKSPRDYSDDELKMYYNHPKLGAEMLSSLTEYRTITEFIFKHHERLNGSGFPRKLVSAQIPIPSLIIGIADEYQHLKKRQFHMKDYYYQFAVQHFREKADKEYPEKLVSAILEILRQENDEQRAGDEITMTVKNLLPSMKLSRNLFTVSGTLLLAADSVLDIQKINRIREISKIDPLAGDIYVKKINKGKQHVC